jgi:hypothetical protein
VGLLDRLRRSRRGSSAPTPEGSRAFPDRYGPADVESRPLDAGRVDVRPRGAAEGHEVPAVLGEILSLCTTFGTLDRHAARIAALLRPRPGAPDRVSVRLYLDDLVRLGLLARHAEFHKRILAAPPEAPPGPIGLVAVLACDRPSLLEASLGAWLENRRRTGRTCETVVLDDSKDAGSRDRARALAAGLAGRSGAPVAYAGREERQRFAAALARESGVAPEVVEFALLDPEGIGRTTGANRNAFLLHAAGRMALSADDDTTVRMAACPAPRPGLRVVSAGDPTEFWFHDGVDAARAAASFAAVDPLAIHERLLGRSLAACVRDLAGECPGDLDVDDAGSRAIARLPGDAGRVVVTAAGQAGDSGMAVPVHYLTLRGPSRERLVEDYERFRLTRGVVRVAPRHAVCESGPFVSAQSAYDHRLPLPPFIPVLRNQDGLFAVTLGVCSPDGFIGHVPFAVEHAPPAARAFAPEDLVRPLGRVSMTDVLTFCVLDGAPPSGARSMEERLTTLGRHLRTLGSRPPEEFGRMVHKYRRGRNEATVAWLSDSLALHRRQPEAWARDVDAALKRLGERDEGADSWTPSDLARGREGVEARRLALRLVGSFGRLLEAWPALVAAAGRLRDRGVHVAEGPAAS